MLRRVLLLAGALAGADAQATLPPDHADAAWGTKGCASDDGGCCCETMMRANGAASCETLEIMLCSAITKAKAMSDAVATTAASNRSDGTQLWVITCGALVFFMQCGFAMLEVGSVRRRNTHNILFKNLFEACIGAIGFFAVGYAFAYGDGTEGSDAAGFIGYKNFFLMRENNDESGQHSFFFQFAFAATGATIISGSVAERTKLVAYGCYSFGIVCWVYPVVAHWVWSGQGWLSAFAPKDDRFGRNGMIDFAGSGVVHSVGGWAGLIGAMAVGPRMGRFDKDTGAPQDIKGQDTVIACLGTLILWFGWYGFNCGSTLAFDGKNAGKVATTTTLGAAFGGVTAILLSKMHTSSWLIDHGMNGILAGLVSITAGCAVVDEWCACVIGIIGGAVYYAATLLLLKLQIDDPLNAWPVHGVGGVWGCIAAGIFAQRRNFERVYGDATSGYDPDAMSKGEQLGVQCLGIFTIVVWTVGNACVLFYGIKFTVGMRVTEEEEQMGLDAAEHGQDFTTSFQALVVARSMTHPEGPLTEPIAEQQDAMEKQTGADKSGPAEGA